MNRLQTCCCLPLRCAAAARLPAPGSDHAPSSMTYYHRHNNDAVISRIIRYELAQIRKKSARIVRTIASVPRLRARRGTLWRLAGRALPPQHRLGLHCRPPHRRSRERAGV